MYLALVCYFSLTDFRVWKIQTLVCFMNWRCERDDSPEFNQACGREAKIFVSQLQIKLHQAWYWDIWHLSRATTVEKNMHKPKGGYCWQDSMSVPCLSTSGVLTAITLVIFYSILNLNKSCVLLSAQYCIYIFCHCYLNMW